MRSFIDALARSGPIRHNRPPCHPQDSMSAA